MEYARHIERVTKDILWESKEHKQIRKVDGKNEEIQTIIKAKRISNKNWQNCKNKEDFQKHKMKQRRQLGKI